MTKELIRFMDDALKNQPLLTEFETEFNKLYDAQGNPIVSEAAKKLSVWFSQKDYSIAPGSCKKLSTPVQQAKGRVMPLY